MESPGMEGWKPEIRIEMEEFMIKPSKPTCALHLKLTLTHSFSDVAGIVKSVRELYFHGVMALPCVGKEL